MHRIPKKKARQTEQFSNERNRQKSNRALTYLSLFKIPFKQFFSGM